MSSTIIKPSAAINQRKIQLELREKLVEIEERRQAGIKDTPAREFLSELREIYSK